MNNQRSAIIGQPRMASLAVVLVAATGIMGCGGASASKEPAANQARAAGAAAMGSGTADACGLLTEGEVAEAVGNPVRKGQPSSGSLDCKWDVDTQGDVTVFLIAYRTGSIREQALCPDLRKQGKAPGFESAADASTWKFERVVGLFNSGEFESCGPKGFISLQLNGKRDEAALKQATAAVLRKLSSRL
jgi:hypothetical protein